MPKGARALASRQEISQEVNRLPERTGTAAIADNRGSENSNRADSARFQIQQVLQQMEVARQRQQEKLELFRNIKQAMAERLENSTHEE